MPQTVFQCSTVILFGIQTHPDEKYIVSRATVRDVITFKSLCVNKQIGTVQSTDFLASQM